jgi:hypothetical protein
MNFREMPLLTRKLANALTKYLCPSVLLSVLICGVKEVN